MNLFHEFSKKAPNRVFFSIVLGGLAGVSYALLIPIVVASLSDPEAGLPSAEAKVRTFLTIEVSNVGFACLFFLLCSIVLFARTLSRALLIRLAMSLTTDLRVSLYDKIAKAPVTVLEKVGPARLTAILTEDVRRIILGGQVLPDLLINLVTLIGMLGFLLYLNMSAFVFVMQAIIFGIATYQIPIYLGDKVMTRSRQILDGLQEAIRGLIYGVKELKLDAVKRESYFDKVLCEREHTLLKSEKRAYTTFIAAGSYGDLLSFFVIGVVAFVFVNYHTVTSEELIGIVMALLYVSGPVSFMMNAIPQIAVAKASLSNVNKVFGDMPAETAQPELAPVAPWSRLTFSQVAYRHETDNKRDGFSVGPVDFDVKRGEITFIVGGNGSGKSTLSKIITLHYPPASGEIRFDDQLVDERSVHNFRQEIGAIFSDYYLFDRILGEVTPAKLAAANAYLADLGLADKITIEDGKFSTLALSDGQRKRLALLVALLDDKPLYLFDEWAADQDPVFKEIFYRKILPGLKMRGKALIVISHDDRYFDVADKLLIMNNGSLASTQGASRNAEPRPSARIGAAAPEACQVET